ncbi:hypothetical protein QE450_004372 [Paenibacillus sp. SORGH_AS306]|nr:hypothetical protein [Paenibacillus sp. SORGH_AS_0306]MDR6109236.1 hypothetical protein [Paenibacillus sp. SORGH_AS_0338]
MDDLVILYIRKIGMVESTTTICSSNRYFMCEDVGFFMHKKSLLGQNPARLSLYIQFIDHVVYIYSLHYSGLQFYNSASISSSISKGSVVDSKRLTTSPLRSIRNLVKFHLIESPGKYSGCFSFSNCTINLDTE